MAAASVSSSRSCLFRKARRLDGGLECATIQEFHSNAGKGIGPFGEAEGEERERLYADRVVIAPGFGEYTRMTSRQIPVMILERIG